MDIRVGEIYRHFSGSFYTVLAVSSLRVTKLEFKDIVVLKKLSVVGEVVTYYLDDFLSEVDGDVADVIGQKFKFVQVKDACYSLAETTTEALVEELKKRKDNPYAKEGDPNVWEVTYEVGEIKLIPKRYAKFEGEQYFEVHSTQDTVEKCLDFIKRRYPSSLRPVIMRVTRTVETSVREIVDRFSSM